MLHCVVMALLAAALSGVTAPAQPMHQTAPVSVGIVLDTSGSMAFKLKWARLLVAELAKPAQSLDEFAFIQASDRPIVPGGFMTASEAAQALAFTQAKGRSALIDGIYLGLQMMKMARNDRKVLLVISDGGDNASRYTETELWNAVSETAVRVYTIGLHDPAEVPGLLVRVAERGRGRNFAVADASGLSQIGLDLNAAIRTQP